MNDVNRKHESRKYRMAVAALLGIFVALFAGYLTGEQFNFALLGVLGFYSAANVAAKKYGPKE